MFSKAGNINIKKLLIQNYFPIIEKFRFLVIVLLSKIASCQESITRVQICEVQYTYHGTQTDTRHMHHNEMCMIWCQILIKAVYNLTDREK